MTRDIDRRGFLARSLAVGCSLAASPLVTPVSLAAMPGDNRLVVIVLRGAMDGLDVIRPVGDPGYAALGRPTALGGRDGGIELDGMFALHPALAPLRPLWRAGEVGVVHAVSTPYRDKRSHFDGQDLLEAGTTDLAGPLAREGWLNRLLQHRPGTASDTAYAVGSDRMALLEGAAEVMRWSPGSDFVLSPQALRLTEQIMAEDPLFAAAFRQARMLADSDGDGVEITGGAREMNARIAADREAAGRAESRIPKFVAERLRADARIAAFSINGWDSHKNQPVVLSGALDRLAETILTLKAGLGPDWSRTAVVAMTEFGRTARINGTRGTDHGTGGAMIFAGGAVRGGRVIADWPGLAEADLYERRDLMPTRDVRAHAGWLMAGLFGLDRKTVETSVFPGVDLGDDPGLLV